MRRAIGVGVFLAIALVGLCRADEEKQQKPQPIELAPDLTAIVPPGWRIEKADGQFRVHQFVLASEDKELKDGVLIITYFGKGGAGGLDANLERWYGMVEQPDGADSKKAAKKHEIKSGDVQITWIELAGTYLDRPFPMSPQATRRPKYRLFAGMIEGSKQGPYFIRAYGPDAVLRAHRDEFEGFLKSVHAK
jgi:hypothetical protein